MDTYALLYIGGEQIEILKREFRQIFHSVDEIREDLFIINGGEDTESTLQLSMLLFKNLYDLDIKKGLKIFLFSSSDFPDPSTIDFLQSIMHEYGICLSLDQASFAQLPDPNIFNFRFLGLFQNGIYSETISVFDFIESSDKKHTNEKVGISAVFEDSVYNFYGHRIARSLAGFHNVLLLHPEDRASMKYIERGNELLGN